MKFKIPVYWQMYGTIEIEAASLNEAIRIAKSPETGLPEGNYVEDSFDVDEELANEDYFTSPPKELSIGSKVVVSNPGHKDLWNHSFEGTVVEINNKYLIVEDQDGECFCPEFNQVKEV